MSNWAIKTEGLGKQYSRSGPGSRNATLRESLQAWLNPRHLLSEQDKFWALQNIDLEVQRGEILGIIGRNGCGKSTLLKLLSRITLPTSGRAILNGRVASLLEIGTGFHHELSGRENIYLNGAILGMSRAEINDRFDEIVEFSGVGDFIEAAVKNYSSGMYVRLAFSVAAHLRTDILLVDEVLAVGDAEFQKRSLGKMNEVVRDSGRTILFVSHNLPVIRNLCTSVIGLDAGELFASGSPDEVIGQYQQRLSVPASLNVQWQGNLREMVGTIDISLNGLALETVPAIAASEPLQFTCRLQHRLRDPGKLHLSIYREGIRLCTLQDRANFSNLVSNEPSVFNIPAHRLRPGTYQIAFGGFTQFESGPRFSAQDIGSFTILEDWQDTNDRMNKGWVNLS